MVGKGSHPALEHRLALLADRIVELKKKRSPAQGHEKITEFGEIGLLEQRQKRLENQLHELNREAPGFRQDVKAEIENLADDLTIAVEEILMRIDSGFKPAP